MLTSTKIRWKKASRIYLDDLFASRLLDIFELLRIAREGRDDRLKALEARWEEGPRDAFEEDDLIDRSAVLRQTDEDLGYALAILIFSSVEDALMRELRITNVSKKAFDKIGNGESPRPNFIEKWQRFHMDNYGSDLSGARRAPRARLPLPSELLPLPKRLNFRIVKDFAWARNKVVHELGFCDLDELKQRRVPARMQGKRMRLRMTEGYLQRVAKHLSVMVAIVNQDLRRVEK